VPREEQRPCALNERIHRLLVGLRKLLQDRGLFTRKPSFAKSVFRLSIRRRITSTTRQDWGSSAKPRKQRPPKWLGRARVDLQKLLQPPASVLRFEFGPILDFDFQNRAILYVLKRLLNLFPFKACAKYAVPVDKLLPSQLEGIGIDWLGERPDHLLNIDARTR